MELLHIVSQQYPNINQKNCPVSKNDFSTQSLAPPLKPYKHFLKSKIECYLSNPHTIYCSVPLSVKPVSKFTWSHQWDLLSLRSPAVTRLWHLSELVQRSDNQCRLFVPCCWVNQRRLHSAPWVLTRTHSRFLPSGHFYSYLACHAYLCSRVINNHSLFLLVTFFLE